MGQPCFLSSPAMRLRAAIPALLVIGCSHHTAAPPGPTLDPGIAAARQQFDSQPGWRPFLDTLAAEGLLRRPEDVPRLVAFFQSDCRMQRQFGWPPRSDLQMQDELAETLQAKDIGLVAVQHVLAAEKDLCAAL
jgi:hypothetical protein